MLPFYATWSVDKQHPLRMVRLPQPVQDSQMLSGESLGIGYYFEGFYILVTGAPTGTAGLQVAQITVTTGIEFQPKADFNSVCNLDLAEPGQASSACVSNLVAARPLIQQLSMEASLQRLNGFTSPIADHDSILSAFMQVPTPLPRFMQADHHAVDDAASNNSFDAI